MLGMAIGLLWTGFASASDVVCLSDGQVIQSDLVTQTPGYAELRVGEGWIRVGRTALLDPCGVSPNLWVIAPGLRSVTLADGQGLLAVPTEYSGQFDFRLLDGQHIYASVAAVGSVAPVPSEVNRPDLQAWRDAEADIGVPAHHGEPGPSGAGLQLGSGLLWGLGGAAVAGGSLGLLGAAFVGLPDFVTGEPYKVDVGISGFIAGAGVGGAIGYIWGVGHGVYVVARRSRPALRVAVVHGGAIVVGVGIPAVVGVVAQTVHSRELVAAAFLSAPALALTGAMLIGATGQRNPQVVLVPPLRAGAPVSMVLGAAF